MKYRTLGVLTDNYSRNINSISKYLFSKKISEIFRYIFYDGSDAEICLEIQCFSRNASLGHIFTAPLAVWRSGRNDFRGFFLRVNINFFFHRFSRSFAVFPIRNTWR